MKKSIAKKILLYYSLWDNTEKSVIVDNIEKILYLKYPECAEKWSTKISVLSEIVGAKPDTVYAWLNRGRKNIKIPFLKLCKIADAFDVDVSYFFNYLRIV